MEFWGIEVKPGETVKCDPGDDRYLHLSQAALGEVKKDNKGNESVPIYVKFNEQRLVIGTLSADKCPQITYDLVFEKEFELSHSWKNGSVFFVGYKTLSEGPDDFMDDDDSDSEDESTPVKKKANVPKAEAARPKANIPKTETLAAKPNIKAEELKKAKEEEDDDDDDSDEDEDDSEEDESDDKDLLGGEDDSDDEDESSEEEATPKKADGKKRPAGSASKTPFPEKKAKLVTPVGGQKTGGEADGKKGGHTATPYPAKQTGKDKFKQLTPKSGGSVSCKSCTKTFKDDNALQAHTRAKHASK